MGQIKLKLVWIFKGHIGQSSIKLFVPEFFFHDRLPNRGKLREKKSVFFCVAVFSRGLCAGGFVNIFANALMDGSIFVY